MININLNSKLHGLIEQGKAAAIRTGKPILVSTVSAVERMDLPAFFAAHGDKYAGNRFFWSEPGGSLSFVGLGHVLTIEARDKQQRYAQIEREWNDVLKNAVGDAANPEHTGPLLFGGFSFDPVKAQTALWSEFSHSSFVVPQYMLTQNKEQAWLTTNMLVSPDVKVEEHFEMWEWPQCPPVQDCEQTKHSSFGQVKKEEFAPSEWMDTVEAATAAIRKGELEKVVLARQIGLKADASFSMQAILSKLLADQSNTYVFAIDRGEGCLVGATPERLIRRAGNELLTLSLAGSIARGGSTAEDDELGSFLMQDVKNLHEHALAVNMIRGAMQELCEHVEAPDKPILRKLKDIQHLATPISGYAREGVSLLQAVELLHPTPALGGMPREAAIEAIRELEDMDRGWYAAPIGWLNRQMDGEFVAAIRSALVNGNEAVLFAGCGIVGDSDPISEFHETALKFRPMLAALQAQVE